MNAIVKALIIFLALLPTQAFAEVTTSLNGWMPPASDAAVKGIAYIFGDVYGIFGTGETTVAGVIFSVFNSAVLLVGMVLVAYIIFAGVLSSAQTGEALGKWDTMFVPLRASLGIAFTLPAVGGYSLIQAVITIIAMLGIGIADTTWNAAVRYMGGSGTVVSTVAVAQVPSLELAGNVLRSLTCMSAINSVDTERTKLVLTPSTEYPRGVDGSSGATPYQVWSFGQNAECGALKFANTYQDTSTTTSSMKLTSDMSNEAFVAAVKDTQAAHTAAALAMIAKLQPVADAIVAGKTNTDPNLVSTAATEYAAKLSQVVKTGFQGMDRKVYDEFVAQNAKDGFAFAGAYYFKIARMNNAATQAVKSLPAWIAPALANESTAVQLGVQHFVDAAGAISRESAAGSSLSLSESAISPDTKNQSAGSSIWTAIVSSVGRIFVNAGDWILKAIYVDQNPLVTVKQIGDYIVDMAYLVGGSIAYFSVPAPTSLMAAFSLPIGMLFISLFTAGTVMATWVPIAPFFIWLMAIIGYLVLLIESIVAAPLWAIMHASPEGHQVAGQGANGYMIVLGLLLRPVLMVIGLIFSMALMQVGLNFLLITFGPVFKMINSTTMTGPVTLISMLVIFDLIVMKIIHRSLSLITEIPSEVMKWAGGGHDAFNDSHPDAGNHVIAGMAAQLRGAGKAAVGTKQEIAARKSAKEKSLENATNENLT